MKKFLPLLIVIIFTSGFVFGNFLVYQSLGKERLPDELEEDEFFELSQPVVKVQGVQRAQFRNQSQEPEVVAENLKVPWEMVFLPDQSILVTERPGTLRKIGGEEFSITIPNVAAVGEGGLLGLALHPDFSQNQWLYLYYTARTNSGNKNQIDRYTLRGNQLEEKKTILENLPASSNHNGGRIAFGPDRKLYVTTGDAENNQSAQDKNSLAGKILRINDDGTIPDDNPFDNAVYSWGHRNPQGLTWDDQGRLWATEHGRSGALSGYDEINLIEKGKNYGWPVIQGDETRNGMQRPIIHSGPNTTWAPAGIVFQDGRLFFAGLRGQALYEAKIDDQGRIEKVTPHFKNQFGRLRNVKIGSDGNFYLLTSNTDGRGQVKAGDDKIIKISPNF